MIGLTQIDFMKLKFLFLLPVFFAIQSTAQYGSNGFDVTPVLCDTSDWFKDMLPNPDGSFYLVGDDTLQYNGTYDTIRNAVISKYNADYTLAWRRVYGGSRWDGFQKIYPYLNGTMLVVGHTSSTDGDVPYGHQNTVYDVWAIIIDSSGNIIHGNSWGYGNQSYLVDVAFTTSGKIFLTGWTAANLGDFVGNTGPLLTTEPFVILADSQLNKIWVKVIVDSVDNTPYCCTVKNDTLVLPLSAWPNSTGEYNFGTPKGSGDVALFYIDTNQNILRKIRLGGGGSEAVTGIKCQSDSLVMLVSTNSKDGDFFSNDIPASNISTDWLTFCNLTSNGQVSWNHSFGSFGTNGTLPTNTLYYFISETSKNLWSYGTVAGHDDGWIGYSPGGDPNSGYGDDMLWQFDTLGLLKRKLRIGDTGEEEIHFLKENSNHRVVIGVFSTSGNMTNNPFTCSVNKKLHSVRLFELTEWPDAITNYAVDKGAIKLFPNPANEELVVEIQKAMSVNQNVEVEIYTAEGKRIEKKNYLKSKFILDTSGYKNGHYYIQITTGKDVLGSRFLIQH